ncbi:MAG: protein kinase [Parachlamydiaceae bacterium]|nr:protein kinase [Parachlamydiaceae bacterium]
MSTESINSNNNSSQIQAAPKKPLSTEPSQVSTPPSISQDILKKIQAFGKEIEELNKRDENILLSRQLVFGKRLSDREIKTEEIAIANALITLKVPLQNQKDKLIKEYEKATNNQEKGQIQFKIANICVRLGEKRNAVKAYKEAINLGFKEAEEYLHAAEELFKTTLQEERRIIEIVDAFAPRKIREDRYYKRGTIIAHRNLQPITKILDSEKITKIKTNELADTQERREIFFNTLNGIGKELSKHSPDTLVRGQNGGNQSYETFISKEDSITKKRDIIIQDKAKKSGEGTTKRVYTAINLKTPESIVSFEFEFSKNFTPSDLEREKNILKKLKENENENPNIIDPYEDLGIVIQKKYDNVDELFEKNGNMSERLAVMQGIANGLAGIHKKGIIHMDLKPANFYYKKDKDNKLIGLIGDFGSAFDINKPPTKFTTTDKYLAPEVMAGSPVTTAADCFSLGISLFKSATSDHYDVLCSNQILGGEDGKDEQFRMKKQDQIDHEIEEQISFLNLALNKEEISKEIAQKKKEIQENEKHISNWKLNLKTQWGKLKIIENEKLKIQLADLERYIELDPENIKLAVKQLVVARKLIRLDAEERISAETAHIYLNQETAIPKEIYELDNKSQDLINNIKDEIILFAKSILQFQEKNKTNNLSEYQKLSKTHLDRIKKYLLMLKENKLFNFNELSNKAKEFLKFIRVISKKNTTFNLEDMNLSKVFNSYLQISNNKTDYQIFLAVRNNFMNINKFVFSEKVPMETTILDLQCLASKDQKNLQNYNKLIDLYKKLFSDDEDIALIRKNSKGIIIAGIGCYVMKDNISENDKKITEASINRIKEKIYSIKNEIRKMNISNPKNRDRFLNRTLSLLVQSVENLEISLKTWDSS